MMRRCGLVLLVVCSVATHAQGMDEALAGRVDLAVRQSIALTGTPSVSVAIVRNDALVYSRAFGLADIASRAAATTKTRYQIASISKTFVAQAVLQLVADGKLTLDDPVSRWFPDLTESAHVTVRQLLAHTSGYPDHYPQGYPAGPRGRASTPDAIVAEWGRHPLLFAPGTQFHYSNLEYEVAGLIVEKVSDQPLFQFLQQRVFGPVGITDAIDLDTIPAGSTALATGYVRNALGPADIAPYEGPGWSFGAGQVVMTAEDLAKWDIAFLHGTTLPPAMLTEEKTAATLTGGARAPNGLGLFVSQTKGETRYYHSGQGLGFTAINLIYPDSHTAIAVLSNTSTGSIVGTVANRLAYLLLVPSKDDVYARSVFRGLQSGHPDKTTWSADLTAYMAGPRLATYHRSLSPLGAVQSFSLRSSSVTDGLQSRDYDVVSGNRHLYLHLLLLADGQLEDASVADAAQP